MADDLYSVLGRFHREVVVPDLDQRFESVRAEISEIREEISEARAEISEVREETAGRVEGLRADIGGVRADLGAEIQGVRDGIRGEIADFRRETLSHFDAIYDRFFRLEAEYHALVEAVRRLENRSLTRVEFDSELEKLKARVGELEERILELERER